MIQNSLKKTYIFVFEGTYIFVYFLKDVSFS